MSGQMNETYVVTVILKSDSNRICQTNRRLTSIRRRFTISIHSPMYRSAADSALMQKEYHVSMFSVSRYIFRNGT